MCNHFTRMFKITLILILTDFYLIILTLQVDVALFVLPSTLGSFNWTEQFFPALICKTIMQFFVLLLFSFVFVTFCLHC